MPPPPKFVIRWLTPQNFLSFGPDFPGVELKSLNVFIGPNGCGKSNLIEAVSFMRACVRDSREVLSRGGGVSEWIWKGLPFEGAEVNWVVSSLMRHKMLRHLISFQSESQAFRLSEELVEPSPSGGGGPGQDVYYHLKDENKPVISVLENGKRHRRRAKIVRDLSILAQRKDPEKYPEITWLARNYETIRIYREWSFGRNAIFRQPQRSDERNDTLAEDLSNLGLVLNRIRTRHPNAKRAILERLKDLYEGLTDFDVLVQGGTVQVFFTEGEFSIPATRLSDGTLRYLCLLAILCDPEPPPLICIEEPELGLHPDIIPKVADMLREASTRTQLIVTTHSDILIDALTDTPESVIVCSKEEGQTKMERLDAKEMAVWLEKYRLGQLWSRGHIGGNRW